jgi:hypothetical protein
VISDADGTDVLSFQQDASFIVHVTAGAANAVPEPSAALVFTLGTLIAAATIKRRA